MLKTFLNFKSKLQPHYTNQLLHSPPFNHHHHHIQIQHIHLHLQTRQFTLKPRSTINHHFTNSLQSIRSFSLSTSHNQNTKKLFFGPDNKTPHKWKTDDILAVFSWIFVSHSLFLLLGTTTFVSTLLFLSNSLSFQEFIAEKVSDILTTETGFKVTFESAILPKWSKGVIRLQNVSFVCNNETWIALLKEKDPQLDESTVDVNWTYYNIHVKHLDVQLSVWQWLDGRGLLTEVKLKGVTGDILREHIDWDDVWTPMLRQPRVGDFELEKFVIEDMSMEIHNKNMEKFNLSVFYGECRRLRLQWLLYDLMGAESIVGKADECLFSVHKPHDFTENTLNSFSTFKISGLPTHHINAGVQGPFGWITKGRVDLDVDFKLPLCDTDSLLEILKDDLKKHVRTHTLGDLFNTNQRQTTEQEIDEVIVVASEPRIEMRWHVKLWDLKVNPYPKQEFGVWRNAMMWSVVGYMNSHHTLIPFTFEATLPLSNFNGAWTIYESGLVDVLSTEVGNALLKMAIKEWEQGKRLRRIAGWTVKSFFEQLLDVFDYSYYTSIPGFASVGYTT